MVTADGCSAFSWESISVLCSSTEKIEVSYCLCRCFATPSRNDTFSGLDQLTPLFCTLPKHAHPSPNPQETQTFCQWATVDGLYVWLSCGIGAQLLHRERFDCVRCVQSNSRLIQ